MIEQRCGFEAVYLKGDVYVFGGRNKASNFVKSVEKYSPSTNEWTVVTNMIDERLYLCACAFINKIFILGGYFYNNHGGFSTNSSCLEFNTKCDNFKEITRMNEARERAACAVYRGNVVVSGGLDNDDNELNSAEYYDAFAYEWTPMPNMVNSHSDHSLVVVKDKLLVVGQGTDCCEVFDVICKKFVAIKHQVSLTFSKCVQTSNKLLVFREKSSSVICYDVDKDEWSEELCEITEDIYAFSLTKLPQY